MQLSPATLETPPVAGLGHTTLNVMTLAVSLTVNQVGKKEYKYPYSNKAAACL